MNVETYSICENWGWYIDIENMRPIGSPIITQNYNKKNKKPSYHLNRLETINEDEYEYDYLKKSKHTEESYFDDKFNNINNNINNNIYYLIRIGTTTIITAILTYVLLFIL